MDRLSDEENKYYDGMDRYEYEGAPTAEEAKQSVDEFLDRMDDDRAEWNRLTDDMYPLGDGGEPDGPAPGHVHRDTDEVQKYLIDQRQSQE